MVYARGMRLLWRLMREAKRLYPGLSAVDVLIAGLEELLAANRRKEGRR